MILQKNTHSYKPTVLALGLLMLFAFTSYAQSVSGKLTFLTNQEIRLEGFNGLQNYPIATAQTDAQGNFRITNVALKKHLKVFYHFATQFPFISITDLKKWDSPIAKDYYVFGTPTMYLLDNNRKIILRPNSLKQMNAWVDWYLIKGNPLPK